MACLTEVQMRYLVIMYEIAQSGHEIHSANIAQRMHVTKPAVAKMLSTLREKGLVAKEPYGTASFTREGYRVARQLQARIDEICARLSEADFGLTAEELREVSRDMAIRLAQLRQTTGYALGEMMVG